jgi:3D (Asp-Asp-Asp) domain-containing protein
MIKKTLKELGMILAGITISFTIVVGIFNKEETTAHAPEIEYVAEIETETEYEIETEVFTEEYIVIQTQQETESETEPQTELISLGIFTVTAYCSCEKCCGEWANQRPLDENGNPIVYGSSGEQLIADYSIAVDLDLIPYGETIYINEMPYVAHDKGSAIQGKKIDIYMSSHQKALEWGRQTMEVFKETRKWSSRKH